MSAVKHIQATKWESEIEQLKNKNINKQRQKATNDRNDKNDSSKNINDGYVDSALRNHGKLAKKVKITPETGIESQMLPNEASKERRAFDKYVEPKEKDCYQASFITPGNYIFQLVIFVSFAIFGFWCVVCSCLNFEYSSCRFLLSLF